MIEFVLVMELVWAVIKIRIKWISCRPRFRQDVCVAVQIVLAVVFYVKTATRKPDPGFSGPAPFCCFVSHVTKVFARRPYWIA